MAKARKINACAAELSDSERDFIRGQIDAVMQRHGLGIQGKDTTDMLDAMTLSVCDAFETFIIYEASS